MVAINGTCDSKFQPVADAFMNCFTTHGEVGASVCVTVEGEVVVDLWGGHRDEAQSKPWEEDTLCLVASASKGIVATAAHMLVDRGELDLDEPISAYWPEYGENRKDKVTLRQVMIHTAGMPFIDTDLSDAPLYDWDSIIAACEAQSPEWEPGSQLAYHGVTFGYIVGEVIRRVSGLMPGDFVRQEIAGPLEADFYIGLAESENSRVADWVFPDPGAGREHTKPEPNRTSDFLNIPDGGINSYEFRAAQIPAGNGITSARGLAKIYRPLALGGAFNGVKLLNPDTLASAIEFQVTGPDAVLGIDYTKRAVGYKLMWPEMSNAFGKRTFGHGGLGGSMGCADPDSGLSFGYVMNKLWSGPRGSDPRGDSLAAAAYASLHRESDRTRMRN